MFSYPWLHGTDRITASCQRGRVGFLPSRWLPAEQEYYWSAGWQEGEQGPCVSWRLVAASNQQCRRRHPLAVERQRRLMPAAYGPTSTSKSA